MLTELITLLLPLVPAAVKHVGGVIGREALDRRARRLENEYGGLFEGDDVRLVGSIASVSALLARFDSIAGKIEAPKKTQSSIVSGILAAAAFYALVTFIWPDIEARTATMYLLAAFFASLALGGSWAWDWAFSALNTPLKYTVDLPKAIGNEEPLTKPGIASYRRARNDLHKQMLSQMAGLMDQVARSETLARYTDTRIKPSPAKVKDKDGNFYPRYGEEVEKIIETTNELRGAEDALAYVVSQRENPKFSLRPLVLDHHHKFYLFSFDPDRSIRKPEIKDAIDFNPADIGQEDRFWKFRRKVTKDRWQENSVDVNSRVGSTFWLPPEIKYEAPEPAAQPTGRGPLNNPG